MRKALIDHMISNELLSDCQHGFIQGKLCTTQLLQVIHRWSELIDEGGNIDNIYLDFAKAFDTVPQNRLIVNLQSYSIGGKVLDWISNFLTDRRQQVLVQESESSWAKVVSGVPQGSVLAPIPYCVLHKWYAGYNLVFYLHLCG